MSSVRVHYDVDVGGSYGVKRGIKHAVLVGFCRGGSDFPVRLVEDRLENMRGGDQHGPERSFDVEVAFDEMGVIRSMKMRALDNVGAYAGRSPFQLGKPVGAIVGPYRIRSVQYQAIAVTTNKTVQEAVRAFGQSPTNYAIERTIEEVANRLGLDRLEVRRRNLIRREEFPYLIPSGSTYDSGDYHAVIDKVLARAGYENLLAERDGCAPRSARRDRHGRLSRAERRQLVVRAAAQSRRTQRRPGWIPAASASISAAPITATMHTTSAGQGHETLVGTVVGEVPEVDPDRVRVVRSDSLNALPSNSPVGSRMAIVLGGAAFHARDEAQEQARHIAATTRRARRAAASTARATCSTRGAAEPAHMGQLVTIATATSTGCRGLEPGLSVSHIMQVPTGGGLPRADGRVQMYPCYSFEFHLVLVTIDPDLGRPEIRRYLFGTTAER